MKRWKEKDIFYFDEYYPYWIYNDNNEKVRNTEFSLGKGELILDIKNNQKRGIDYYKIKLLNLLENHTENIENTNIITFVPSSTVGKESLGLLEILKHTVKNLNHIELKECLVRNKNIEKLATGGNRSVDVHLNSINVIDENYIKGKNIILIDDVTTTGNSLIASKDMLIKAGANKVLCLSFVRTFKSVNEACIALSSLKHIIQLDKKVQEELDNYKLQLSKVDYESLAECVYDTFLKFKGLFKEYNDLIPDKFEMQTRKREVYLYLIEQLDGLKSLEYTFCCEIPDKYIRALKISVYKDLIVQDNNLEYLSKYYDEIRSFQKKYGCNLNNSLEEDNYIDLEIVLTEYTIQKYKGNKDLNLSAEYHNYIAKALYESNTEYSLKKSLENINKAIEKSPLEIQLYLNKATILIENNEFKNALDNIVKALTLNPKKYSKIVPFDKSQDIIFKWLKNLSEIVNSVKINFLLAMYIYKVYKENSTDLRFASWNIDKNGELKDKKLTYLEQQIKILLHKVNEKVNNKHIELSDLEIINKTREKRSFTIKSVNRKSEKVLYKYKDSTIDVLKKEEDDLLNDCDDYYSDSYSYKRSKE